MGPTKEEAKQRALAIAHAMNNPDATDGFTDSFDALFDEIYDKIDEVGYGCHIDLEEDQEPDHCVIDAGNFHQCIYAKEGMRKEDCVYWKQYDKSAYPKK